MKKRSVTIRGFVVTLLMIPYLLVVLGFFSSYVALYHRFSFQASVMNSHESDLKTLSLSVAEYQKIEWTEEGKEFEYGGKMFDVAKVEQQGKNYLVTCENDALEDLFVNWMKSAGKTKSKVIPQIQLSQPIEEIEIKVSSSSSGKIGPALNDFYSFFLEEIIPPPPRVS